jgi:hypothetical protein
MRSTRSIQLPKFSQSPRRHGDPATVVSLPLYRAQRRMTQVAIRRRAVVALVLCLAGIVGTVLTVEREVRLQRVEVRRG